MLEREPLISNIASRLSWLSGYLKLQASQNLTSPAVLAEDFFSRLLNMVFGYDLVNANALKRNYPGIDLEDAARRLAYQITIDDSGKKIREVHEMAVRTKMSERYDQIVIFFLVNKSPTQPKASGNFEPCQVPAIRTTNLSEFLSHVRTLELGRIAAVDEFLQKEIRMPGRTDVIERELVYNLPFSSIGPLLKGRGEVFSTLRRHFDEPATENSSSGPRNYSEGRQPLVIHALGGVGKTRLAVEYAWRHKNDYRALFYASASEPGTLKAQIAALASRDLMGLQPVADLEEQYSNALQWFRERSGWLLILDNVDTRESISAILRLLPHFVRGHVCITSRSAEWPASVMSLDLAFLGDDDGRDYLLESTQGLRASTVDDENLAGRLSARLGGLPLALEHAAAYIKRLRLGFSGYLAKLDTAAAAVLAWSGVGMVEYPVSVAQTWLVTFGELSTSERLLLGTLSFVDSAVIPRWLFSSLKTDVDIEEVLGGLAVWHFLTWTGNGAGCTIHPLVSEVTRHQISRGENQARFLDRLNQLVDTAEIGNPQNPAHWDRWDSILPHVLRMVEHLEGEQIWRPAIVWKNRAAVFEQSRAHYESSALLLHQAWDLAQRTLWEQDDLYATVLNNWAGDLRLRGQFDEAETLYRHALKLAERQYGLRHDQLVVPLNNLGELLRANHKIEEARDVFRRALDLVTLSEETRKSMLSTCLSSLGETLFVLGETEEAESMLRKSLETDEKEHGKNNPWQTVCLNNLGELLRQTGRLIEAEGTFRLALDLDKEHRGEEHPHVARVLNNWALLKAARGHVEDAETMLRKAVEIDQQAFGTNHPTLAPDFLNLSEILFRQNKDAEALVFIEKAVSIYSAHGGKSRHAPQEAAAATDLMRRIRERVESPSE